MQVDDFGLTQEGSEGRRLTSTTGVVHFLPDAIVVAARQVRLMYYFKCVEANGWLLLLLSLMRVRSGPDDLPRGFRQRCLHDRVCWKNVAALFIFNDFLPSFLPKWSWDDKGARFNSAASTFE